MRLLITINKINTYWLDINYKFLPPHTLSAVVTLQV